MLKKNTSSLGQPLRSDLFNPSLLKAIRAFLSNNCNFVNFKNLMFLALYVMYIATRNA